MTQHDNCQVEPIEKLLDYTTIEGASVAYLAVSGMGCPRCAIRVQNGLLNLDGVLLAEAQLESGIAMAAYDPSCMSSDDLISAIDAAGNDGRHHYVATLIEQRPAREVSFCKPS